LLNTIAPFIQPNHRIISIEDTRELQLPDFLHWVPLTTREPNPEGRGEITMLDLMINSLRMRPDRIIVGEIRRAEQAEVLFEAMHTGHSVYATLHADAVDQVIRRMTNPPINIPDVMMEALHVIAVQYRDRRKGIRRTYQVAEIIPTGETGDKISLKPNILYRCRPDGEIVAHDECVRVFDVLKMHTGMTSEELVADLSEKVQVLNWMVKNNVENVNEVGETIGKYYSDREKLFGMIKKNAPKSKVLEVHQSIA
jgi:flagellar protein FlaI